MYIPEDVARRLGLALGAKEGDPELAEWFDLGLPALREALRAGGLDAETADCACAEILHDAWPMRASGREIHDLRAWAAVVAANHDRRRKRRQARTPEFLQEVAADCPGPAEVCERCEEHELVRRASLEAAQALPPPLQQIVLLQFDHGASRRDVIAYLRRWRPISEERARALLRQAHAVHHASVRARLEGEPLPAHASDWPREALWQAPPPPLASPRDGAQ